MIYMTSEEFSKTAYAERYAEAQGIYAAGLDKVKTTPPPSGQKYPPGTRVKITGGNWHKGELATVEYTYGHAYCGDDVKSYSLLVDGHGSSAWFDEGNLTPIAARKEN